MNNARLKFNARRRVLRLLRVPPFFLAVLALTVASACLACESVASDDSTKETEEILREGRKEEVKKNPSEQEKIVRLGARVAERAGFAGLQITEIVKDSPAERVGLKVGDFIVRIGKRNTVKEDDYDQIVDTEPRKTTITFVRNDKNDAENDGKKQTVEIELNGTPIPEPSKTEPSELKPTQIGVKVWFELEDGTFVNPLEKRWKPNERFYVHIEAAVPLYVALFRVDPNTNDSELVYPSDEYEDSKKPLQARTPKCLPTASKMFRMDDNSNDEIMSLVAVRDDWFGSQVTEDAYATLKYLSDAALSGKSEDSATIRKNHPEISEERAKKIAEAIGKDVCDAKFQAIGSATKTEESKNVEDVCVYLLGTSSAGQWTLKIQKQKQK